MVSLVYFSGLVGILYQEKIWQHLSIPPILMYGLGRKEMCVAFTNEMAPTGEKTQIKPF
jgi:hypothetical protein